MENIKKRSGCQSDLPDELINMRRINWRLFPHDRSLCDQESVQSSFSPFIIVKLTTTG